MKLDWRREWRHLRELFLLPALAALLPWPVCFRLFRWLCQHTQVYREEASEALQQALAYGVVTVDDAAQWLWQRQLVTLVDHADLYLSATRGQGWMRRYWHTQGAWPEPGKAAVLLTFHWGAGMWALRDAAAAGLAPHMLLAAGHDSGSSVANTYARWRAAQVQRCAGRPLVPVHTPHAADVSDSASRKRRVPPGALRAVTDAGEALLAVIDVPPDQAGRSMKIDINGLPACAPLALFEMCAAHGWPLTVYWTDICLRTGHRLRVAHTVQTSGRSSTELADECFAHLASLLREQPVKWHFWALAKRYFKAP